jgi:hypothetical protein
MGGTRHFPRAVFLFDLALCAVFAVPGLSAWVLLLLGQFNANLGLPGQLAPITGGAHFFVNFAGLLGVLLNFVLLQTRDRRAHWANIWARGGVIGLIGFYIAAHDLPWIFLVFVLTELGGGIATIPWLGKQQ